ncbi:hypothetical protein [Spirulina sp. 06S082]|uniref:hypothetical protein n=1 Tax=Spirulina sp. 06S082 TaxID=3110248 RepID=UPI002B1EBD28|nr:hypothetical protein [Spirulina sp. 06S082]MEA5467647.1 hypothetical protein [Spirulina sp. 06S082]
MKVLKPQIHRRSRFLRLHWHTLDPRILPQSSSPVLLVDVPIQYLARRSRQIIFNNDEIVLKIRLTLNI